MNIKQIIDCLKGKTTSLKGLLEALDISDKRAENELLSELTQLADLGLVGKEDERYFLLEDRGYVLAEVVQKNKNFALLVSVSDKSEYKISGFEAVDLFIGDLLYLTESYDGYHLVSYYKNVEELKGYYTVDKNGEACLDVPYLTACGKKIFLTEEVDARVGDMLLAKIVKIEKNLIRVKPEEILVKSDEVGYDISTILEENDIRIKFPKNVDIEAKNISQDISEYDLLDRKDYRSDLVVTIDGDDARDFDDAFSIKKLIDGYKVTVHIADVTSYVKPHSALDDEAKLRGTSIYVADRVVPMLPFELSNGICSLNPNEDRLTLSVEMSVDKQGNAFAYEVHKGVIKSSHRLTYREVNAFFKGEENDFDLDLKNMLSLALECAKGIRKRREIQGALRLNSTELKFTLDEDGNPTSVKKVKQGEAEKMIEDLMIIANCSVARMLEKKGIPVLYRVHEKPLKTKLAEFRKYLKKVGLASSFPKDEYITGHSLSNFLDTIKDDGLRENVATMLLRAMAKAEYSPEAIGHFGLQEPSYCHFTSPIRRYPDCIIHRLIKDQLIENKPFDRDSLYSYLDVMGISLSKAEVKADAVEREVDKLESCKYMASHIGESYKGKVSGIISKGLFVTLENGIEGLLLFRTVSEESLYYSERDMSVKSRSSDISYSLGSPILVTMLSSDLERREITLCSPEFYNTYALNLSDEDKRRLALEGVYILLSPEEVERKARPHFASSRIYNGEKREKRVRLSDEDYNDVKLIQDLNAKFNSDEEKIISVLEHMNISKEDYLRLKPYVEERNRSTKSRGYKERRTSNHSGYQSKPYKKKTGFKRDRNKSSFKRGRR